LYIAAIVKDLHWVGRALDDLREFPAAARREAGHQLHLVQLGLEPADWRPMPSVGIGVVEIRLHDETEHRIFYVARYAEAIYVLHAFEKKSQKTASRDIDIGRHRLKELRQWRRDERL
jgi:phage-related protein